MMPTVLGSLRSLLMSPDLREVTFARRGFPTGGAGARPPGEQGPMEEGTAAATETLEAIPQAVICGFEWGIDARDLWEIERRLRLVDVEQRGFAYEGATMAFTIRDVMGPRGHRARDLLVGPGRPYIFLTYIGIGFAMARLPRVLWRTVMPDLTGSAYYPTMTWFAVDGYGFDRAYFDTRRWVDEQRVPASYPWEGSPDYFLRAVDQGIGRALWFIHAARPDDVAAAVERFASRRHADLWSGAGLAATFAGGCDGEALAALRRSAGEHRAELCQGAVFAAKARDYAGFVPAHTETAIRTLADLSVSGAVRLADDSANANYELWRRSVQGHFSDIAVAK